MPGIKQNENSLTRLKISAKNDLIMKSITKNNLTQYVQ